jgi:hypothetical protein
MKFVQPSGVEFEKMEYVNIENRRINTKKSRKALFLLGE